MQFSPAFRHFIRQRGSSAPPPAGRPSWRCEPGHCDEWRGHGHVIALKQRRGSLAAPLSAGDGTMNPKPNNGTSIATASRSRRDFVKLVGAGGTVAATGLLTGCFIGDVQFDHGVASGDPLSDRVMLWTRVSPSPEMLGNLAAAEQEAQRRPELLHRIEQLRRVVLRWEVALDPQFRRKQRVGAAIASPERDYTVKVDVGGLRADTIYYFRFVCRGVESPVGRTRTLPSLVHDAARRVKLAVFSCSNYPAGYFNVYGAAAAIEDLDAAVHLGDYIYEYDRNGYASERAAELGRVSEPAEEIVTLAAYRRRHAQYRSDPDLQRLTARVPLIAVWDDHELANDAWRDGAQNHTPATEGQWSVRRAAAIQAYYEWMPIREPAGSESARIYRSFDFGSVLSLHMLDTRVIGRDQQLSYASFTSAGGFDAAGFAAAIGNPARELLGAEQSAWLSSQLSRSSATWQVLGQQVLIGRMNIPSPILFQTISISGYAALVAKAQSAPGSLTDAERAILAAPSVPYNLDAWDGYAAARERLFGAARALDRNLVVLAGDTHNAWANDLADLTGQAVGVEFATASVSSPGFEAFFPNENPVVLARSLEALIGPLAYADTSRRGFLLINASMAECRAQWQYVSTVFNRSFTTSIGRELKVLPGAGQRRLLEV
jgi:alkaline phosphatase D